MSTMKKIQKLSAGASLVPTTFASQLAFFLRKPRHKDISMADARR